MFAFFLADIYSLNPIGVVEAYFCKSVRTGVFVDDSSGSSGRGMPLKERQFSVIKA